MNNNKIEELQERLEELHRTQDARLACNADDLDIREEIAEAEDEIKELQDDINEKNNNGNDTNVGSIGNSIEEDIKIALDKVLNNKDIESAIFIVEKFILGNYIIKGGRNTVKDSLRYILSDYKRVLKENEKIRNGRNRLFEYATAQQTTPEMLNKILRENYISKDKIKEILEETEITDFNSLVEAFLKIKKLLESE